jgi:hypothetical protein
MNSFDRMIYRAPRRGFGWLYPTTLARAKAAQLQSLVQGDEIESTSHVDDRTVGIAAIHGRQNIVLLVAWAEAHHRQLVTISRGVWIIGVLILLALNSIVEHLPN